MMGPRIFGRSTVKAVVLAISAHHVITVSSWEKFAHETVAIVPEYTNKSTECGQMVEHQTAFDTWRKMVNFKVQARIGVSIDDLPDKPYMSWYEDEISTDDACEAVMDEEGFND